MKIFLAYLLGFLILAFLIYNGLKSKDTDTGNHPEFRQELKADNIRDYPGSPYGIPAVALIYRQQDSLIQGFHNSAVLISERL